MVHIEMCVAALSLLVTDSTVCDELNIGIQRYMYT